MSYADRRAKPTALLTRQEHFASSMIDTMENYAADLEQSLARPGASSLTCKHRCDTCLQRLVPRQVLGRLDQTRRSRGTPRPRRCSRSDSGCWRTREQRAAGPAAVRLVTEFAQLVDRLTQGDHVIRAAETSSSVVLVTGLVDSFARSDVIDLARIAANVIDKVGSDVYLSAAVGSSTVETTHLLSFPEFFALLSDRDVQFLFSQLL